MAEYPDAEGVLFQLGMDVSTIQADVAKIIEIFQGLGQGIAAALGGVGESIAAALKQSVPATKAAAEKISESLEMAVGDKPQEKAEKLYQTLKQMERLAGIGAIRVADLQPLEGLRGVMERAIAEGSAVGAEKASEELKSKMDAAFASMRETLIYNMDFASEKASAFLKTELQEAIQVISKEGFDVSKAEQLRKIADLLVQYSKEQEQFTRKLAQDEADLLRLEDRRAQATGRQLVLLKQVKELQAAGIAIDAEALGLNAKAESMKAQDVQALETQLRYSSEYLKQLEAELSLQKKQELAMQRLNELNEERMKAGLSRVLTIRSSATGAPLVSRGKPASDLTTTDLADLDRQTKNLSSELKKRNAIWDAYLAMVKRHMGTQTEITREEQDKQTKIIMQGAFAKAQAIGRATALDARAAKADSARFVKAVDEKRLAAEQLVETFQKQHGLLIGLGDAENILAAKTKGSAAVQQAAWNAIVNAQRRSQDLISAYWWKLGQLAGQMRLFGGIALGAFGGFLASTNALAENIRNVSEQTGLSFEGAQRMIGVFQHMGLPAEKASEAFKHLSTQMEAAWTKGGPALELFAKVGISLKDLANDSTADIFLKIGDGLKTYIQNPSERAAIAAKLLGRNSRDTMKAFILGTEHYKSIAADVPVLLESQADGINKIQMAVGDLKTALMALGADALGPMAGQLTWVIHGLQGMAGVIQGIPGPVKLVVGDLGLFVGIMAGIGGLTVPVVVAFNTVVNGLKSIRLAYKLTSMAGKESAASQVLSAEAVEGATTTEATVVEANAARIATAYTGIKAFLLSPKTLIGAAIIAVVAAAWSAVEYAADKAKKESKAAQEAADAAKKAIDDLNKKVGPHVSLQGRLAEEYKDQLAAMKKWGHEVEVLEGKQKILADRMKSPTHMRGERSGVDPGEWKKVNEELDKARKNLAMYTAGVKVIGAEFHKVSASNLLTLTQADEINKTIIQNVEERVRKHGALTDKEVKQTEEALMHTLRMTQQYRFRSLDPGLGNEAMDDMAKTRKNFEKKSLADSKAFLAAHLKNTEEALDQEIKAHKIASVEEIRIWQEAQKKIIEAKYLGEGKQGEENRRAELSALQKFADQRADLQVRGQIEADKKEAVIRHTSAMKQIQEYKQIAAERLAADVEAAQAGISGDIEQAQQKRILAALDQKRHENNIKFARMEMQAELDASSTIIDAYRDRLDMYAAEAARIRQDLDRLKHHGGSPMEISSRQGDLERAKDAYQTYENGITKEAELQAKARATFAAAAAREHLAELKASFKARKDAIEDFNKSLKELDAYNKKVDQNAVASAQDTARAEIDSYNQIVNSAMAKVEAIQDAAEREKALHEAVTAATKAEASAQIDIVQKVREAYKSQFEQTFDFLKEMGALSHDTLKKMSADLEEDVVRRFHQVGGDVTDKRFQSLLGSYKKIQDELMKSGTGGGFLGSFNLGAITSSTGKAVAPGGMFAGGPEGPLSDLKDKLGSGLSSATSKMMSELKKYTEPASMLESQLNLNRSFVNLTDVVNKVETSMRNLDATLQKISGNKYSEQPKSVDRSDTEMVRPSARPTGQPVDHSYTNDQLMHDLKSGAARIQSYVDADVNLHMNIQPELNDLENHVLTGLANRAITTNLMVGA